MVVFRRGSVVGMLSPCPAARCCCRFGEVCRGCCCPAPTLPATDDVGLLGPFAAGRVLCPTIFLARAAGPPPPPAMVPPMVPPTRDVRVDTVDVATLAFASSVSDTTSMEDWSFFTARENRPDAADIFPRAAAAAAAAAGEASGGDLLCCCGSSAS